LIGVVRYRGRKIAEYVLFFEGTKSYLLKDLVELAVPPPPELIEPIQRSLTRNQEAASHLAELAATLRKVHSGSRLANEFDRVCEMLLNLNESLLFILEITKEGTARAESLERLRCVSASIDAKIDRYMDDEEFDPELMALAGQAIDRIQVESKAANARN
jgi:hypothetical protein